MGKNEMMRLPLPKLSLKTKNPPLREFFISFHYQAKPTRTCGAQYGDKQDKRSLAKLTRISGAQYGDKPRQAKHGGVHPYKDAKGIEIRR